MQNNEEVLKDNLPQDELSSNIWEWEYDIKHPKQQEKVEVIVENHNVNSLAIVVSKEEGEDTTKVIVQIFSRNNSSINALEQYTLVGPGETLEL